MHSPLLSAIGAAAVFVVDLENAHGKMKRYFSCVHRPVFSVITLVNVMNEKMVMIEIKMFSVKVI